MQIIRTALLKKRAALLKALSFSSISFFFFLFFTTLIPFSSEFSSLPALSPSLIFLLLFWWVICFQKGRLVWVRAGGSVSASSLDMFRLKPFAPRNNLLWNQTAAGLLVSSGGNLKWFEYVGVFFPLGSSEFKWFCHPYNCFEKRQLFFCCSYSNAKDQ